jgi:MFS family permease
MSPREAGSIMVAQPVMMVIVSALSGRMSDKYQPRVLASLGLLFVVVGLVMLVFLTGATRLSYIALSLSTIGFGFGLFSSPNTNAIMGSVEKKYLGMASALSGTMRITGQLLSMAMAALVLNVVVGNVTLSASNASLLVRSSQVIFITCSVLCVLAVVTSFLGRNISFSKKSHGN